MYISPCFGISLTPIKAPLHATVTPSSLRLLWWLTFDIQDHIGGGAVADEALGRDAPQVVLRLGAEAHSAPGHDDAAAGRQEALLQQLQTGGPFPQ